jgi:uncharacterized integral membrane protein
MSRRLAWALAAIGFGFVAWREQGPLGLVIIALVVGLVWLIGVLQARRKRRT